MQKAGGKAAGDQWTQVTYITNISYITYILISIIDNKLGWIRQTAKILIDNIPGRNCLLRSLRWMRGWHARWIYQVIFCLAFSQNMSYNCFSCLFTKKLSYNRILTNICLHKMSSPSSLLLLTGPSTTWTGSSRRLECLEPSSLFFSSRNNLKIKDLVYDPEIQCLVLSFNFVCMINFVLGYYFATQQKLASTKSE